MKDEIQALIDAVVKQALRDENVRRASMGGFARAAALSPARRKEIAQAASRARWAKKGKAK